MKRETEKTSVSVGANYTEGSGESLRMGIETGARLDSGIYPNSGDALTPCLSDFEKKRRDRLAVQ